MVSQNKNNHEWFEKAAIPRLWWPCYLLKKLYKRTSSYWALLKEETRHVRLKIFLWIDLAVLLPGKWWEFDNQLENFSLLVNPHNKIFYFIHCNFQSSEIEARGTYFYSSHLMSFRSFQDCFNGFGEGQDLLLAGPLPMMHPLMRW